MSESRFFNVSATSGLIFLFIVTLFTLLPFTSFAQLPAFPGAAGYGGNTVGGRGGVLYEVTNLNNSGPGSFREACEASCPRIVVFRTGGEIKLTGSIKISDPFITIAGQTAPGDGITIRGADIIVQASEVIIRGIRVRVGTDIVRDWDGIAVISSRTPINNVIVDHCSVSWSIDENFSTNGLEQPINNVTFSCNISSEGLNNPSLHSKGDYHAMGMLINKSGVNNVSVIGNLFAHNRERQPKIGNGAIVEVVNNVVYNWENKGTDVAPEAQADIIGNYYKTGPSWSGRRLGINIEERDGFGAGQVYVRDNIGPGREDGTGPEWDAVTGPISWQSTSELIGIGTSAMSAQESYDWVLDHCGASVPRDAHDQRIVDDVRNGTGSFIGLPSEVGGFLTLDPGTPPTDTDRDGMPDTWESANGLNPNDASDMNGDRNGDGYTNIEEYVNSLFDDVVVTPPTNQPPSISNIFSQSIDVNEVLGPIDFTIGDLETAANDLTVTASSDNQSLVADGDITLSGSGTDRSITLTPVTDQSGTANISITVSDGAAQTTETFLLTVNAPTNNAPTISNISNQTIDQDTQMGPVAFTVSDVETNAGALVVTATSNNQTLLPNGNITIGGSGTNRTITATPVGGEFGNVGITVTVSDGVNTTDEVFVLTVNEVGAANTAPTISDIGDQTVEQGGITGAISFTIGDAETPAADLTVTGTSNNGALVRNVKITFGGSGANRTVTVEPTPSAFGQATITVTVSDGVNDAMDNFILTVTEMSGGDNPPFIELIPEQTIYTNETLGPLTVNISDPDTDISTVTLRAESSQKDLFPDENITIGGSGATRTITITPATDQVGSAPVTLTAFDGVNSFVRTMVVNVIEPNITFSVTVDDANCQNEGGAIDLSVSGGVAPYTYSWSGGASTPSLSNLAAGTYTLTVTDDVGNQRTASFVVNADPGPTKPVITVAENTLSAPTADSYQWFLNGVEIDGAVDQDFEATEAGDYMVIVYDESGCSASSDEIPVTPVSTNTDISRLSIYPNPVSSEVNIDVSMNTSYNWVGVAIYTLSGRPVYKRRFGQITRRQLKQKLNLSKLRRGAYIIKIKVNKEVVVRRLIKV